MATAAREYPTYQELRARRLAEMRARGLDALRRAETEVAAHGGWLRVFGSFAEGGLHDESDIDVVICGVPVDRERDMVTLVEDILDEADFASDIFIERRLSDSLRQRVLQRGRAVADLG